MDNRLTHPELSRNPQVRPMRQRVRSDRSCHIRLLRGESDMIYKSARLAYLIRNLALLLRKV
jgi:hypothetical protein